MAPPRNYIDENLRGLARWLRFLGFDTALAERGEPDRGLLEKARREGRILFTRDRALWAVAPEVARLLDEERTRDQLARVLEALGAPAPEQWFSRCVICNLPLREVSVAERGAGVPAGFSRCWRCDGCGRTYWRGSHYERARKFLESLPAPAARGSQAAPPAPDLP